MTENPVLTEINNRLDAIEKVLDEMSDSIDSVLDQLLKAIENTNQIIADQPNRTGTTIEKNQQTIFNAIIKQIKMLETLGAQIDEVKEEVTAETP